MNCPRCNGALPDGARFCMHCGAAMAEPGRTAPPTRRWLWPAIATVGVLLALIGIAMGAVGLLRYRAFGTPELAKSAAPETGDLARQGGASPSEVTKSAAPESTEMPPEIKAWLEHLCQTEEHRVSLTKDQLGKLLVQFTKMQVGGALDALKSLANDDPNAPEEARSKASAFADDARAMRKRWSDLTTGFNSTTPPTECVAIRDQYDQVLRETSGMMLDVLDALGEAETNPEAAISTLTRMQGTSSTLIDSAARKADEGVAGLCDKYRTRKWFDIVTDVGGNMLSKLGLGF